MERLGGAGNSEGNGRHAVAVDLIIGGLETVILLATASRTALAIPPESAPAGLYQHVVTVYSSIVLATAGAVLAIFVIRHRRVASVLQALVAGVVVVTVLLLRHSRITNGLTGY